MSSWSTVKNECSKMLQLYWTLRMIAIECRNRSMWFPTTRSTPIAITWSALRISQRSSIPSWKLTTFQCAWTRAKLIPSSNAVRLNFRRSWRFGFTTVTSWISNFSATPMALLAERVELQEPASQRTTRKIAWSQRSASSLGEVFHKSRVVFEASNW